MGTPSKRKTSVLIVCTFVIYAIHLVFNGLASTDKYPKLFPNSTSEVSKKFDLEITPTGATFSIWGVIFAYQLIWLIYSLITIFRTKEITTLLCKKFYFFYIINIIFVVVWLLMWSRELIVMSFIMITLAQIFLELSFAYSCADLKQYIDQNGVDANNRVDVWCQRILVQNGILFYATWTTVATLINTGIVFSYQLGASTETASIICLVFLTIIVIAWFYLENFFLQKYTEYTVTAYIGLIWALSGIFANIWGENDTIGGFVLGLLILSIIFFIARIVILVLRASKASNYETIGYNNQTEAVRT